MYLEGEETKNRFEKFRGEEVQVRKDRIGEMFKREGRYEKVGEVRKNVYTGQKKGRGGRRQGQDPHMVRNLREGRLGRAR